MLRIQITTTNTSIGLAHSSEHYWLSVSAFYRTSYQRDNRDSVGLPATTTVILCLYACYTILSPGSICPYRS